MKKSEINIRDPFVLYEDGVYYMYGTRGKNFGVHTGGFDVYVSRDLENWEARECFDSAAFGLNDGVNWAPEVHKYEGKYYLFATFNYEGKLRGTHILSSSSPLGPFEPHSDGQITKKEWECLDGTFYVEDGEPYMVFCHEHTQIIDGAICYVRLSHDLKRAVDEPVFLFKASEPYYANKCPEGTHYVTDGPFMYRGKNGRLFMIWSTFIDEKYAECLVRFNSGSIKGGFEHMPPLILNDGGHGMIFDSADGLYLTYHSPNSSLSERPFFRRIEDEGDTLAVK